MEVPNSAGATQTFIMSQSIERVTNAIAYLYSKFCKGKARAF
jgi:hypothetical protein